MIRLKLSTKKEETALKEAENSYASEKQNQANIEKEYKKEKNNLDSSKKDLDNEVGQNIKNQENKVKEISKSLENDEKSLDQTKKDLDSVSDEINSKEKAKNSAKEELDKEKEKNPNISENLKEAENKVNDAKKEKDKSQKAYDEKSKNLEEKSNELNALEEKKASTEKEISKKNEELTKIKEKEENLKREISELKEKISNISKDSKEFEKYKTQLDEKEKEIEDISNNIKNREAEKNKAKASLDEINGKIKKLKEENLEIQNKIDKLNSDKEEKENNKKAQEKNLGQYNKQIEEISNENKQIEESIKDNETKIGNLDSSKKEKENIKTGLVNEKSSLEKELLEKNKKLAELEKNNKDQISEEDKKNAQKQWNRGSIGFFEKMGSQKSLDVFTKIPENQKNNSKSSLLLEMNKTNEDGSVSEGDARSLNNMKEAIKALKVIQEKRQKDRGIDGRELSIFRITDYDMAVAQANANYASKYWSEKHSEVHPQQENLYTETKGSTKNSKIKVDGDLYAKEALSGWWDGEKDTFDKLRAKGYKNRDEMDQYLESLSEEKLKELGFLGAVGHYTNLVDDLMWEKNRQGDSKYPAPTLSKSAGYAIKTEEFQSVKEGRNWYWNKNTQALELNPDENGEKTYSIEDYEKRLNEYMDGLTKIINGKVTVNPEVKGQIDAIKKEISDLELKIKEKITK